MKTCFTSIALLLVAILVTIMQVTAAPVEQDNNAAVEKSDVVSPSVQDLYEQYYASMASPALAARDEAEPARRHRHNKKPLPFPPPPIDFPPPPMEFPPPPIDFPPPPMGFPPPPMGFPPPPIDLPPQPPCSPFPPM